MQSDDVRFTAVVPVVPVTDVREAVDFYRDKLGFEQAFEAGPDYVGVTRLGVELHLDGVVNAAAGDVSVRITTDGIDALYAELEPGGVVHPDEPLETKPWGLRQFSVLDPSGNRLTFAQPA
jgi:catechol 2,3-dioxygenase-like lactoylglutathione lyase family enzyme